VIAAKRLGAEQVIVMGRHPDEPAAIPTRESSE
jgi:hypothetical protein